MIKKVSQPTRILWISIFSALLLFCAVMMFWLNHEPAPFNPIQRATVHAQDHGHQVVTGYTTTATLIETVNVLLNKRGGYLSNDILPPWVFLDNVPNWEFGVLTQVRDISRSMRNDFSRSQTQSTEDQDLMEAEPMFHYDSERWFPPDTEGRYRKANDYLEKYLTRLSSPGAPEAQFYARADNLADWLATVEKRLGSLSQRLSASVGQARGTSWALVHFLHAMEVDFDDVLRKKNALISFRQIIRELESTQMPLHSPMVLNGGQFGLFANHSLVMANYISRANAAIIDLRNLLQDG